MNLETVIYEVRGSVAVVSLNRPRVLNAMNKQLWLDLRSAFQAAADDSTVRVVIVTGSGRAFSTGADLKDSQGRSLSDYRDYLVHLQEISRMILRFEKPTIAAVNGYALGSGYELALACDLRLMAESARIGSPEAKVSSSVTGGAMRLVPLLIGPARAKELMFTAEYIDGRRAEEIGLVNRAVPDDQLMDAALELAEKITANSTLSLKLIKRGIDMSPEVSLEALMDYEVEACLATVSAPERDEALTDFHSRKD